MFSFKNSILRETEKLGMLSRGDSNGITKVFSNEEQLKFGMLTWKKGEGINEEKNG